MHIERVDAPDANVEAACADVTVKGEHSKTPHVRFPKPGKCKPALDFQVVDVTLTTQPQRQMHACQNEKGKSKGQGLFFLILVLTSSRVVLLWDL